MKMLSILMCIFALSFLPTTSEARAHNKHARKPASAHHTKKHVKKSAKVAKNHHRAKAKRVGSRYNN